MLVKEVQEQLHISSHTLRYYEKMGLIKPERNQNGYRNYDDNDIRKIKKIIYLRELEIPIEEIKAILNNEKDFQNVLESHLKKLDYQIKSLKYIQEICNDLKEKDLPLLDVITNENTLINENINQTELKTDIKKIFDYFKPIKTVVLGYRVDPNNFFSAFPLVLFASFLASLGIAVGLPKAIDYLNQQLVASNLDPLPNFETTVMTVVVIMIISLIIFSILITFHCGKQKYIELTDNQLSICSLQTQSRLSILKGMILKDSKRYNRNYQYSDLDYVKINLIFSTTSAGRSGIWRTYILQFVFHFQDDFEFITDSGQYFGEDLKLAYQILKQKDVKIISDDIVVEALKQDGKLFDFFEDHFHLNSKK